MHTYNLKNKNGEIIYTGTYDECKEREVDYIEYAGSKNPVYVATNNEGICERGTMRELSKKLNTSVINLYNYTHFERKYDGLFIKRED